MQKSLLDNVGNTKLESTENPGRLSAPSVQGGEMHHQDILLLLHREFPADGECDFG